MKALLLLLHEGDGSVCDWQMYMQAMQRMSDWREGVYVRLHGNLSEFEGKFRILAFNVRKVTDFNEVRHIPKGKQSTSKTPAHLHAQSI